MLDKTEILFSDGWHWSKGDNGTRNPDKRQGDAMGPFRASAQYDDWVGTAAADDIDPSDIRDLLEKEGLIKPGEFIVGITFWLGENHPGQNVKAPYVSALLIDKADFETVAVALQERPDPLLLRKVDVKLTLEQFIGLFKRFSIALCRRGLDITGREYLTPG